MRCPPPRNALARKERNENLPRLGARRGRLHSGSARPLDYLGGFVVAFYVVSATVLAPRMGVGNFIVCAVCAQIVSAVIIDHFGLFGAALRPIDVVRAAGVALLLAGVVLTQLPGRG